MRKIAILAIAALFIASCVGNSNKKATGSDSTQTAPADTAKTATAMFYGDIITEDSAMNVTELATKMTGKKEMKVKLTGSVEAVCQKKGCWMDLTNPGAEALRVTFKDYGFFMPKDASGKTAIVEGVAKYEETSVADLKEYAKDAGKTKDEIAAIKAPKQELVFEANGVILK